MIALPAAYGIYPDAASIPAPLYPYWRVVVVQNAGHPTLPTIAFNDVELGQYSGKRFVQQYSSTGSPITVDFYYPGVAQNFTQITFWGNNTNQFFNPGVFHIYAKINDSDAWIFLGTGYGGTIIPASPVAYTWS